jgi:hypothetical protein|tara:strand:- start:313 stop:849 length:537 start_codon:yes stop_codon:yes gene_type:complete
MALDSDAVRVAVSGSVYVGPVGTAPPTDSGSVLEAGFKDLGYLSSDGISEDFGRETTTVKGWQNGATLREITSGGTYSVSMTFLETNLDVLELYFGATITDGVLDGNPASTGGRKSFVFDVLDGPDNIERTYIPSGEVTSVGERVLVSGEAVGYSVVLTAYADANDVTYKKFFSSFEV